MRLIDADVLKQHIDKLPALPDGNFAGNHSALKALINMQPTVQPEVIRCGECVNFVERDFCKVAGHNVHRKSNCMKVFGAERRTDADD